jgi:hypothetical protein
LKNVDEELELFKTINSPYDKTLALLIHLSPSPEIVDALQPLRELVRILDNRFRYAVQVKTPILVPRPYNFFANNNIYMVWNQIVNIRTPPIVTADFLYQRFIGYTRLLEKDFGRLQKNRNPKMRIWVNGIKRAERYMMMNKKTTVLALQ